MMTELKLGDLCPAGAKKNNTHDTFIEYLQGPGGSPKREKTLSNCTFGSLTSNYSYFMTRRPYSWKFHPHDSEIVYLKILTQIFEIPKRIHSYFPG